jgi:TonB-dependent receptor
VDNYILNGKHSFLAGDLDLEWKVMPTMANVDEPDIRVTGFEKVTNDTDGSVSYEIRPAVGADVNRAWRYLHETNLSSKIDLNYRFNIGARSTKLSMGALNNMKARDFSVYNYVFRVSQQSKLGLDGNADNLFTEANIWTPETNAGTYIRGNFEPANTFNSSQELWAGYILNELPINTRFKAIYGLRAEHATINYTGQSNDGQRVYNDEEVLNELDLLPSLNLVYELVENMNLRFSASKTVARPTFKEKSLAQIQDRVSGRTFLGNIDLEETKINNFDLRWEYFFKSGQMLSVSSFYKTFKKPIELVAFDAVAPNNFQPKNGDDTQLYGVELEVRKDLDFISPVMNGLNVSFNTTFVRSKIQIDDENVRPLVGQSPYIINGILAYNNADFGLDANLSYNVQGERLSIVGIGTIPSVYEQPFHALNFKISKKFGIARNWSVSLSGANLLNQDNYFEYKNEGESNVLFQRLSPGRSFSFSFSWLL